MPEEVKKIEKKSRAAESDNAYNVDFIERTSRDSYLYPDSMLSPWNPDDLVQKNQDYSVYNDMTRDDQVSVCLQIKKDLVLSSGFDFVPGEDGQEGIVEDLQIAICEDPEWSFEEMLEEILSAYEFGFSASEKVFKNRDDGKLSLRFIKTRYPGTWRFHTDPAGNITKHEQLVNKTNIEVPKNCLIHYINNRRFQNPYGVSDLRPAYQAWFTKKHITRWYAIFIEKAASPITIGRYDEGITASERDEIYAIIKKFQTKTSMLIPKGVEIEFLEAKSKGEAFTAGINIFNMFIGRSLLIPDLLGFQGGETAGGAYALGKSQMEIFFKHIRRRRIILERVVNNEIVWPIVLYNFGYVDNYPKFRFKDISKEEVTEFVKLWLDAVKSKVYVPSQEEVDHFRNIINFPISEEETVIGEPKEKPIETDVKVYPTGDGGDSYKAKDKKYQPASGMYGNKTDFDLLEKQLDTAVDTFLANSAASVDEIFNRFTDDLERKKIVSGKKVDKLDTLALKNVSSLRTKLSKALIDLYKKSKETASSEIFKSKFAKPLVSEEFLKILDEELYQFIGDWEYNVTKAARLAIIQAIKDGKSITQVIDIVNKEAKDRSLVSLETYSRTKFTEVMNKGRLAFFNDTGVVGAYQYSAILDDRTCFAAGTLVRMADLSLRPIEAIKPGEYVISGNGKARKVKARKIAIARHWRKINLEGAQQVRSTSTHPFWTFQSGGFGWVEANDLTTRHEIGRIEMRYLRKEIPFTRNSTKEILQSEMLLSEKKSKDGRSELRTLRKVVSSPQELVEFSSDWCEILQSNVSSKKSDKRHTYKRIDKNLHKMSKAIQNKARGDSSRFESNSLQQRMSETKNRKTMSELPKEIRFKNFISTDLLQSGLLSILGGGNKPRNWDKRGIGSFRYKLQTGGRDREFFDRFPFDGENSYRSGRNLLASQSSGLRQEERGSNIRSGLQTYSYSNRPMEQGSTNTVIAEACHDILPIATSTVKIKSIEIIEEIAFCYDLEIEHDHSYLVGNSNLIVHNTDICRGLHGKVFKAGTEPVPPMHFNCRSMLIPITIYEEFEPDEKVGQTPIEDFIEEKKGKGFPTK